MLPFDQKLNCTLHRMNEPHNPHNIGDGVNYELLWPVDAHYKVIVEYSDEDTLRRHLLPHAI